MALRDILMYVQTALKGVAELCWRELYIVMEIRKKHMMDSFCHRRVQQQHYGKIVFIPAFLLHLGGNAASPTSKGWDKGWRFGVAVTRWSRSTQLLYIEPG